MKASFRQVPNLATFFLQMFIKIYSLAFNMEPNQVSIENLENFTEETLAKIEPGQWRALPLDTRMRILKHLGWLKDSTAPTAVILPGHPRYLSSEDQNSQSELWNGKGNNRIIGIGLTTRVALNSVNCLSQAQFMTNSLLNFYLYVGLAPILFGQIPRLCA